MDHLAYPATLQLLGRLPLDSIFALLVIAHYKLRWAPLTQERRDRLNYFVDMVTESLVLTIEEAKYTEPYFMGYKIRKEG